MYILKSSQNKMYILKERDSNLIVQNNMLKIYDKDNQNNNCDKTIKFMVL